MVIIKHKIAYVVFALLVLATLWLAQFERNYTLDQEAERYRDHVQNVKTNVLHRLHKYEMILRGSAALFGDEKPVDSMKWTSYFEYYQIDTLHPGFRDAAYIEIVHSSVLAQHEEMFRVNGYPNYTVWPQETREAHAPVTLAAPDREEYQRLMGFDAFSEPALQTALEKARDTGNATVTERLHFGLEPELDTDVGFLMVLPVYTTNVRPETIEERTARIQGYVVSFFLIEELMADIFADPLVGVAFELYDGMEPKPYALLYDSYRPVEGEGHRRTPMFASTETIEVNNRPWTFAFETLPAFEETVNHHSIWVILASGLAVSVIIFLHIRLLSRTEQRAQSLAKEMTLHLEEGRRRVLAQSLALQTMIFDRNHNETLNDTLSKIMATLSQTLGVARTSVWLIDGEKEELHCISLYEAEAGIHSSGSVLSTKHLKRYFSALQAQNVLSIEDAQKDPRTSDLTSNYLEPLGITSMMEAGIFVNGRLKGSVSAEQVDSPRIWHEDEQTFVVAVAALVSQALMDDERRQTKAFYEAVVETQTEMICRYRPDSTLTFVNDAYCRSFGKKKSELIGSKYLLLIPAQAHEAELQLLNNLSPDQPRATREYEITYPDGSLGWQSWSDQAFFDGSGQVVEIQGVGRDITAQKRAEHELLRAYDATIEGWAYALDLRDEETEHHSRRVTELTIAVAKRLGIGDTDLVHVRRGAILHDIGKMGIPDAILLKPGKLTEEEWEIMCKHPSLARDMLSKIDYLREAATIPYSHHEKWDGSGYPQSLKGEKIPLPARVFAVADVYDALTSDRPYRKAWPAEKTLEYIKEQSGQHFDPQVVRAFLEEMEARAG